MHRAVTFDFWRTLIWEPAGELERVRVEHWVRILAESGHVTPAETVAEAHEAAFQKASASWRRNEQYRIEHATADMLDNLQLELPSQLQERLVAAFSDAGLHTPLETAVGAGEALRALRVADVRIGIVCDVGLTPSPVLREHLHSRGLLELFDHWSFSDEVGAYKPDVRPFEHACAGLGVAPDETAHVGDQRRTDVAGALAAGLTAVRYRGVFDDLDETLPEGDFVVDDLRDLAHILGVG